METASPATDKETLSLPEPASAIADILADPTTLFQLVAENTQDLVALYAPDGTCWWVSPSLKDILGYTFEEFVGHNSYTFLHPGDLDRIQNGTEARRNEEQRENRLTYRIRHKDGHYVWFETLSKNISDAEGKVVCIRVSSRDVTERLHAEEALRLQKERMRLFNEITADKDASPGDQIEAGLALALQTLGLDIGIVSEIDTEANRYVVRYCDDPEDALGRGQVFPLGETYCSLTMLSSNILSIHHMARSEYVGHPCYESFGLEAYMGVRLVVGGQRFGTINFSSATPRQEPFTESDRDFIRVLGRWVESVLEQQQADKVLREREAFLSSIYTGSGSAIFVVDVAPDGAFYFSGLNPVHEQLTGLSSEETQGKRPEDLDLPPEVIAAVRANYDRCLEAGSSIEYEEMIPFRGQEFWWLSQLNPLRDETGRIYRLIGTSTPITARRLAEDTLREREATLRSFYESAPVRLGIVEVHDHDILCISDNLSQQEVASGAQETLGGRWVSELGLSEESVAQWRAAYARSEQKGGPVQMEYQEGPAWNLASVNFIEHVATGGKRFSYVVENITERKHAEEALRESEARLNHAQSIAHLGGWGIDIASGKTYWSDEFFRICGLEPGEVEPSVDAGLKLIHPDDHTLTHEAVQNAIKDGTTYSIENRVVHPDGTVRWILSEGEVVQDEAGQSVRLVGSLLDITERKQAEEQLRGYARKAEAARKSAEAAAHAKNDFLAKMSHEIRTPMNGVLGMTELLLGTPLSNHQRRYAETIATSGEVLLHLIDDVLDMAKIEAGQIHLEQVPFNVRQMIAETVELFAARAEAKDLRLVVHVGVDTPRDVIGDPYRLRQVLTNLISNAIKFTEQGEVRLCVSVAETQEQTMAIRFQVSDTGIGIAEEAQARLFQAFEQAENATTRKYGGTGLGLAISRQLVEMMGGQIELQSELGVGTTFEFTVALERTAGADQPSADWDVLQTLRVLLVGGAETERAVYREQMEHWGMTVDEVPAAPGALQRLCPEDGEMRYDVVMVDQDTPVLPGLTLIQAVQTDRPDMTPPFILISGVGETAVQTEAIGAGAMCIMRPVRPSDLLNALNAIISGAPAARTDTKILHEASRQAASSIDVQEWPRVLIVEDNPVNQHVVEGMLQQLGFAVDLAENGLEAVEKVRQGSYVAVLMDCQMPEMDGFEATQIIRRDLLQGQPLPIIALTANVTQGYREECLAAGMDAYLSKPFKQEQLATMLKLWVKMPSTGDGAAETRLLHTDTVAVPTPVASEPGSGASSEMQTEVLIQDPVLISLFLTSARDQIDLIKSATASGDAKSVYRGAHSLKGSAGMAGADVLQELAKTVEDHAAAERLSEILPLVEQMEGAFQQMSNPT